MSAIKSPSSETRAAIEAQARDWFVRLLDEDVGREDLLAWGRWLDANESHRQAYERVEHAWRYMQAAEVHAPAAAELAADRYLADMSVARWRKAQRAQLRLAWPVGVSLLAVLVAAVIGGLWMIDRVPPGRQFATQRAQHMEARLEDGSRIHLGAMTTLKIAFGARQRAVKMVDGEALFHVAHDRARPFVVSTPLAAITAVGTAFDIDIETHAVNLAVTEGIVSVAPDVYADQPSYGGPGEPPLQIHAGQHLRMERDGARLILALSDGVTGATWTEGRLEYRNATLRSVIDDVNRYTTKPIVVADSDLDTLQYTGTVQLQSADMWVLGLPAAFPLTVELNDHGQFVLRAKPQPPVS